MLTYGSCTVNGVFGSFHMFYDPSITLGAYSRDVHRIFGHGAVPQEVRFTRHECAVSNDGTHKQSRVRLWQERTGRKCLHRRAPFPEGPCGLVDLEIG